MWVLSYLANQDKRFQTFIANRVATIHGGSQLSQWKHVDSDSNLADDVSRALSAQDLMSSKRWIHGPHFLWKCEVWSKQRDVVLLRNDDSEVHHVKTISAIKTETHKYVDRILLHFSSWYSLKKCIAWVLHYHQKLILLKRKFLSIFRGKAIVKKY